MVAAGIGIAVMPEVAAKRCARFDADRRGADSRPLGQPQARDLRPQFQGAAAAGAAAGGAFAQSRALALTHELDQQYSGAVCDSSTGRSKKHDFGNLLAQQIVHGRVTGRLAVEQFQCRFMHARIARGDDAAAVWAGLPSQVVTCRRRR